MATVYCRACKAKISYGYNACPKCGAATSRIIPIIFAIAIIGAGVLLFSAYRDSIHSPVKPVQGSKTQSEVTQAK